MENRQSYLLVGTVTLLLVLGLFAFVLWLSRYSGEEKKEFDIFFRQSVAGLAVGSAVSFSGVPVGQVRQIALMPETPEFVRVRIEVAPEVPVLEGTTAALQGIGFTGVTQIQLSGSQRGQPALTDPGPFGVPVIPATASGFGELLESAPQVLERVSVLLARLNEVFDDDNRAALGNVLANLDRTTGAIAEEGPALRAAIREAETTLEAAGAAAAQIERTGASAETLLSEEGRPLVQDLRRSIQAAAKALERVEAVAAAAEPGVQSLTSETIPEVNRLVLDLRDISRQLGAVSAKLDEDPLGAVVGGRTLPDYEPEKTR
jgi:phospholipid/cholesterol/gamma-HCH transport system substrate-binding protein